MRKKTNYWLFIIPILILGLGFTFLKFFKKKKSGEIVVHDVEKITEQQYQSTSAEDRVKAAIQETPGIGQNIEQIVHTPGINPNATITTMLTGGQRPITPVNDWENNDLGMLPL